MSRKKFILAVVITALVAVAVLVSPPVSNFFKVDSCLDDGGRWNDHLMRCEFE